VFTGASSYGKTAPPAVEAEGCGDRAWMEGWSSDALVKKPFSPGAELPAQIQHIARQLPHSNRWRRVFPYEEPRNTADYRYDQFIENQSGCRLARAAAQARQQRFTINCSPCHGGNG